MASSSSALHAFKQSSGLTQAKPRLQNSILSSALQRLVSQSPVKAQASKVAHVLIAIFIEDPASAFKQRGLETRTLPDFGAQAVQVDRLGNAVSWTCVCAVGGQVERSCGGDGDGCRHEGQGLGKLHCCKAEARKFFEVVRVGMKMRMKMVERLE